MSQGNLFWLASYPKSGNTWTRLFIGSLLEPDKPFEFDETATGDIASARSWIENVVDFDIGELSAEEIDALRPAVYLWSSQQLNSPSYHKVHDAYIRLGRRKPLFPDAATRGALYLIRNPLDVAVSFSFHFGQDFDKTIEQMADSDYSLCGNEAKLYKQSRQKLLSWSEHVLSWIDSPLPKLVVRYEDMIDNPLLSFTRIAQFLALPHSQEEIERALELCKIDKLQQLESQTSFSEKLMKCERFFRKGEVGDWRNHLNDHQVESIIETHGKVMQRVGYLSSSGELLI